MEKTRVKILGFEYNIQPALLEAAGRDLAKRYGMMETAFPKDPADPTIEYSGIEVICNACSEQDMLSYTRLPFSEDVSDIRCIEHKKNLLGSIEASRKAACHLGADISKIASEIANNLENGPYSETLQARVLISGNVPYVVSIMATRTKIPGRHGLELSYRNHMGNFISRFLADCREKPPEDDIAKEKWGFSIILSKQTIRETGKKCSGLAKALAIDNPMWSQKGFNKKIDIRFDFIEEDVPLLGPEEVGEVIYTLIGDRQKLKLTYRGVI